MTYTRRLFTECPKCTSKKLEVGVTAQVFYYYDENGRKIGQKLDTTDAGFTKCLNCNYTESM